MKIGRNFEPGARPQELSFGGYQTALFPKDFPLKARAALRVSTTGNMKIVCLSDTHNKELRHPVPDGDLLIHTGDATVIGTIKEIGEFADWFLNFPHRFKLFVPGNHDWLFYKNRKLADSILYRKNRKFADSFFKSLHDESVEIEGLRVYGSSWQPEYGDWAFGLPRGKPLRRVWQRIPEDTDILITHTPPKHILDNSRRGWHVGCEELFLRLMDVRPRLHVFGHLHSGYGQIRVGETLYVNAAICNEAYEAKRRPIVIEL